MPKHFVTVVHPVDKVTREDLLAFDLTNMKLRIRRSFESSGGGFSAGDDAINQSGLIAH